MPRNGDGVNGMIERQLTPSHRYGKFHRMTEMRKITAFLPTDLLATAQASTGEGVTETLRQALEHLAHAAWSRRMLALEGKVKLDIDLEALREDREFNERGNVIG